MINMLAKSIESNLEIKNLSKKTSKISQHQQYHNMNYSQLAFHASLFPLLNAGEKVSRIKQGELFSGRFVELLEIKDHAIYSLRMLMDYFLTTKDGPSQLYCFRWMNLGMMSNGKSLTLNISYHKTGQESLSSVLEKKIDEKYFIKHKMTKKFSKKGNGLIQAGNIDRKGHNSIWGRVYTPNGISSTIKATGGGLGAKTGLYIANAVTPDAYLTRGTRDRVCGKAVLTSMYKRRIRRLTPRECERLQGFPDDFTAEGDMGKISDTQRYKMMGNAVSVSVIEAIGRKILEISRE